MSGASERSKHPRSKGRGPRHAALATLSVLASIAVGACLTPTQITVRLTTNSHCPGASQEGDRFSEADIVAGHKIDPSQSSQGHVDRCPESDRELNELGTLVLQPLVDEEQVEVVIVAGVEPLVGPALEKGQCLSRVLAGKMAEGDPCIVARRRVGFVSHVKLELEVELDTRCTGRVCELGSTCYAGACVSEDSFCDASSPTCRLGAEAGATGVGATSSSSGSSGTGQGAAGGAGGMSVSVGSSASGQGGMSSSSSISSSVSSSLSSASVSSSLASSSVSSVAGTGGASVSSSSGASSSSSASSAASSGVGGASSSSSSASSASSGAGTGGASSSSSSVGGGTCSIPTYNSNVECLAGCPTACMTSCSKNGVCVGAVCNCL